MTEQTSTIPSAADIQIVGENAKTNEWALVVRWEEPEAGECIHGIYRTKDAAIAATYEDATREQYAAEGEDGPEVMEDVAWIIVPVGMPRLI